MELQTFFDNFEVMAEAPNGVEELRNLTLAMAMAGKLTVQSPSEGSGRNALDSIISAKDRYVKQNSLRKAKSLDAIKPDEIPHELPTSWIWVRLGEIVEYAAGKKVSPKEIDANEWLLELEDVEKNTSKILQRLTFQDRGSKSTKSRFDPGDVLYGKLRPYLNKIVVADAPGVCTTEIVPLKPFGDLDSKFLMYALKRPDFLHYVNGKTYGVKMPRLGTGDGRAALVPLPPLEEQNRIVAKVDQLMALCDELEEKKEKRNKYRVRANEASLDKLLNAQEPEEFEEHWQRVVENFDELFSTEQGPFKLRRAINELAVRGKLVPNDTSEPVRKYLQQIESEISLTGKVASSKNEGDYREAGFEIPDHWEFVRFDRVARIAANLVKPNGYLDHWHIAPNHITKETGQLLDYTTVGEDGVKSPKHLFRAGQILYSKIRPNLGKAVLVDFDGLCSADMYPIDAFIDSQFLLLYMLSPNFITLASKGDTRVAMPKINQKELSRIPVPVPPLSEQKKIVRVADRLMRVCDDLEDAIAVMGARQAKYSSSAASAHFLMEVSHG